MSDTYTPPATDQHEWTEIGESMLLPEYRDLFLAVLAGDRTVLDPRGGDDVFWTNGIRWVAPTGLHPMSPGLALQNAIKTLGIRPVTAVSHNLAWEADETSGKIPGDGARGGDYVATYSILGIRTRRQAIYLLDGGVSLTPVLVTTLAEPAATLIEEDA